MRRSVGRSKLPDRTTKSSRFPGEDGSLIIPGDLAARWSAQIVTPYADLSEAEKESDREQVRRYLPLIVEAVTGSRGETRRPEPNPDGG